MKHRKLRLENLQVESFEVEEKGPSLRGTVHGHAPTDICTPNCSENGGTCDFDCGASFEQQRECAGTFSCPGGCGTGSFTAYPC